MSTLLSIEKPQGVGSRYPALSRVLIWPILRNNRSHDDKQVGSTDLRVTADYKQVGSTDLHVTADHCAGLGRTHGQ